MVMHTADLLAGDSTRKSNGPDDTTVRPQGEKKKKHKRLGVWTTGRNTEMDSCGMDIFPRDGLEFSVISRLTGGQVLRLATPKPRPVRSSRPDAIFMCSSLYNWQPFCNVHFSTEEVLAVNGGASIQQSTRWTSNCCGIILRFLRYQGVQALFFIESAWYLRMRVGREMRVSYPRFTPDMTMQQSTPSERSRESVVGSREIEATSSARLPSLDGRHKPCASSLAHCVRG
ncbi:hypothetical protein B0T13DRAFT_83127 [Neurospora crassa]|nr:hypothetical protein B0T13DRAFT_83127 [Neurospora crassa]